MEFAGFIPGWGHGNAAKFHPLKMAQEVRKISYFEIKSLRSRKKLGFMRYDSDEPPRRQDILGNLRTA